MSEWWRSYFDAQYLLEYEPIFSFERDRNDVARIMDVLGLPSESKSEMRRSAQSPMARG